MVNGCCELSWTTTKVNVNIDTTNERGQEIGTPELPCTC